MVFVMTNKQPLMIVNVMDRITEILFDKYKLLLEDLSIGYPLELLKIKELLFLIHILHYVKYDRSLDNKSLSILAYYE